MVANDAAMLTVPNDYSYIYVTSGKPEKKFIMHIKHLPILTWTNFQVPFDT